MALTRVIVQFTTPLHGSLCVDEYRVFLNRSQNQLNMFSQSVENTSQTVYTFDFATDLCREQDIIINAVAITNGIEGMRTTVKTTQNFKINRTGANSY